MLGRQLLVTIQIMTLIKQAPTRYEDIAAKVFRSRRTVELLCTHLRHAGLVVGVAGGGGGVKRVNRNKVTVKQVAMAIGEVSGPKSILDIEVGEFWNKEMVVLDGEEPCVRQSSKKKIVFPGVRSS